MDNNAPFYPGVNHANASKADLPSLKWFKPQPMGVNKLNSLMKDWAQLAGIGKDKRITNHSARKTLVEKLQDNNIPPTQIVQITGHKNLQSVNNYSSLREQQQQYISSILSSVPNVGNA
jgi:integrase